MCAHLQDDPSIQSSVFLSRTAMFSDRLVVFIGDSDGSPAGIWSSKLCVRSGHEGADEIGRVCNILWLL